MEDKQNGYCATRRTFCKMMAGIAIGGSFIGFNTMAFSNSKSEDDDEKLVAACGAYCGACPAYLSTLPMDKAHLKVIWERCMAGTGMPMKLPENWDPKSMVCDGCLAGGTLASHCSKCEMRLCAKEKKGATYCVDCDEYPCKKLSDYCDNDKLIHHNEFLKNLENLKKQGIKKWSKYEKDRWTCPECGTFISWFDHACVNCGTKRSEKLFPLG